MKFYQVGECQCKSCQSACEFKPGWFRPEQIKPLAKALGLSVEQLFEEHLQIDWWVDDPNVYVLSPRLINDDGGTMFPGEATGVCHWYQGGKCAIHTLGKPAECQQASHADEDVEERHSATADSWRAPRHQKLIRDLYGTEPEAEEDHTSLFGFGSIFNLF